MTRPLPWRGNAPKRFGSTNAEIAWLSDRVMQLEKILRKIEYVPDDREPDINICPECTWKEGDGHDRDCELGYALHPEEF